MLDVSSSTINSIVEYKGPVFLIKETDDPAHPFVPSIVDGGIELTNVPKQQLEEQSEDNKAGNPPPPAKIRTSSADVREDVEYFAVLVTPETIADSQIPQKVDLVTPLGMLLYAASARIPWMLALKKSVHYDYYRSLVRASYPVTVAENRKITLTTVVNGGQRSGRSTKPEQQQQQPQEKKYPLMSPTTESDRREIEDICANILKELMYLNTVLHSSENAASSFDEYGNEKMEQFDFQTTSTAIIGNSTAAVGISNTATGYQSESELFVDRLPGRGDLKFF